MTSPTNESARPPGAGSVRHGRERVFLFLAPAFFLAAIFHAAALVKPSIAEPAPVWFHALFVVANLLLVVGVLRRPRGFALAFALYMIQQLVEHGTRGVRIAIEEHRLDWASLVSVVFVPIVFALLVSDARAKRARRDLAAEAEIQR
jgi:hypothetical protein